MSDNLNQRAMSPANMDNDEERKKMLAGAFDSEDEEDGTQDGESVAGTSPAPSRTRVPNRGGASRFNKNRNATPVQPQHQVQNAMAPTSQPPVTNPTNNQMMGGFGNNNNTANTAGNKAGFHVEGTNIGSRASEPEWTPEQLQRIATALGTVMRTVQVNETRRSTPDRAGKYLAIGANDSIITKAAAILPDAGFTDYQLGIGRVKPDEKTGKSKLYTDIVMKGPDWLLSQWTSKDVVMEGVPDNILNKPPRMVNGRPERRIGHDFVRVGLPKFSFGPIFETLRTGMPSLLDGVSQTTGYYWLNASWGVSNSPGNFLYKGAGNQRCNTHKLYEAMSIISGFSSMGAASIAVSIGNESKMEGGKLTSDPGKYELSIKIHNMWHVKKVSYHSPPQSSATGFEVSDDIFAESEVLEPMSNVGSTFDSTASAFSGGAMNPFFNATAGITTNAMPGGDSSRQLL